MPAAGRRAALLIVAAVVVLLGLAASAQAFMVVPSHFVVTTTADTNGSPCTATPDSSPPADPTCSLREAIAAANAAGAGSGFVDVPPGTYTLTVGALNVTTGITVASTDGARTTRISAGHSWQVFTIANTSSSIAAKLNGLTIADAETTQEGGGVSITGTGPVEITDSAIVDNHSSNVGAGVFLNAGGKLTIYRSLVARNASDVGGGGLFMRANGSLHSAAHVISSTFAHNSATDGSAVFVQYGDLSDPSVATLDEVTIAANSSTNGSMLTGQNGVSGQKPGIVSIGQTIVGDSQAGTACGPHVEDRGYNVETGHGCSTAVGTGTLTDADPKLGPLEDNGGATDTMAIGNGSAALDLAPFTDSDQRAFGRTNVALSYPGGTDGNYADSGAYEAIQVADLGISGAGSPATIAAGNTVTYTLTVTSPALPQPAPDVAQPRVHDTIPAGTQLVSAIPSQGTCTGATAVDCTLGRLANGSSATVAITVRPLVAGSITNHATVSSPRFDSNAADDATSQTTTVNPAPVVPGPGAGAPALTGLSLSPTTFRAAAGGPSAAATAGATVRYTLSAAATVTFRVTTKQPGRKVGKRCVKPARKNAARRKCMRTVTLPGSFSRVSQAGANSFRFTGRLKGRKLKPGSYRLVGVARDAAGNKSKAVAAAFQIVR